VNPGRTSFSRFSAPFTTASPSREPIIQSLAVLAIASKRSAQIAARARSSAVLRWVSRRKMHRARSRTGKPRHGRVPLRHTAATTNHPNASLGPERFRVIPEMFPPDDGTQGE
jgi:hypothetical protein